MHEIFIGGKKNMAVNCLTWEGLNCISKKKNSSVPSPSHNLLLRFLIQKGRECFADLCIGGKVILMCILKN